MYICNECGARFEDLKEVVETHGLDTPPYETWYVCPHCGENDVSQAVECSRCGEWVSEHDVRLDDNLQKYCDICYEDLGYE